MAITGSEYQHSYETNAPNLNHHDGLDEEKTSVNSSDFAKVPDGGLTAWLVAAGAACITFSALGFANSFGIFQEYYITHQLLGESPDDIAWIGSLSAFLQFAAGAAGGPLFDRYGAWIIRPAAVLYILSIMMTSLCHKYWHFMLAQGVLMGTTMGFLQFPALAAVSQYFDKKRAAALGVAISGSSIGGVVIPIALSKMLNSTSLDFGWTVRIIGFFMVPLMAFACVTVKSRLPPRTTTFFMKSALKETRFVLLIAALFFMLLGMFLPLFFIPSYAVSRGMSPTSASYLLAILNAASTFGRIVPGILADKFGRLNVFSFGGICTGIIILCLNQAQTNLGLIIFCIFFGFASGTILSGASASFTLCPKDPRDFGTYLGVGIAFGSIAVLIGPPINGALIETYGGYLQVSMFSGIMCLVGGCIAFVSKAATPQGILGTV